jgi:bis(5'-adenosyl)-triphosphatase
MSANLKFGPFSVASQVFHLSPSRLSYALVNLKPLLPGHVLVCPTRCTPRLSQLSQSETADLFTTVQRVSRMIERVFDASSLNVAIQDGVDAGQSVPHVHVHIIPRKADDLKHLGGGDKIYDLMDGDEGNVGNAFLKMQQFRSQRDDNRAFATGPDADRVPRREDEMRKEAAWLKREMEKDSIVASEG